MQKSSSSTINSLLLLGVVIAAIYLYSRVAVLPSVHSTVAPALVKSNAATHVVQAGHQVVRIDQNAFSQYDSQAQYDEWALSDCSIASMVEVADAYGRHYRIADLLPIAIQVHVIDPDLGLLYEGGIARLAEQIGFTSRWGHQLDLDHVVKTANAGQPVIVSFPPQPGTLFPTGHILVVVGGNASQVFLADSSSYNFPFMSRSRFLKYWRGFSAVLSPRDGGQQA